MEIVGYKGLIRAVVSFNPEEEILSIREKDIQAIDNLIFSKLTTEQLKVIRFGFGLDAGALTFRKIFRVTGIRNAEKIQGEALEILRQPENICVFNKLFRSKLEETLERQKKVIAEVNSLYRKTLIELRRKKMLEELNFKIVDPKKRQLFVYNVEDVPVKDIDIFDEAILQCLRNKKILKISDLVSKKEKEILSLPKLGKRRFSKVSNFIKSIGLEFAKA